MTPALHTIFTADSLVPPAWRDLPKPWYAFNPAIIRFDGELLMAYRLVLSDDVRRMAVCRLDERHEILPGSIVPLSDAIADVDSWQADPRFCVFDGRLFIHFNNGFKRPNSIFLVELSPETLLPIAPSGTATGAGRGAPGG